MTARELKADVVIIGGGVGGFAAALSAIRCGARVVLTEESPWLGGQLTAQGVAPDEHPWIEEFGCTASYRLMRNTVRRIYREHYPLRSAAYRTTAFNPGAGKVGKLCAEPAIFAQALEEMLCAARSTGRLTVLRQARPVAVEVSGDAVMAVTVEGVVDKARHVLHGAVFLDATETGELLKLGGIESVTGAESQTQTGEPSAKAVAQEDNVQSFTWSFALAYDPDADHTIERPASYARWRDHRPAHLSHPQFSWSSVHPRTRKPRTHRFNPNPLDEPLNPRAPATGEGWEDLWLFRRMFARNNFEEGAFRSDVTLVNWSQNGYFSGNVLNGTPEQIEEHKRNSRELSLSFLYWLQTEAPRPDGRAGYPGLHLRPDAMGTEDGFAMQPYHRESRRIKAIRTIVEQDVSAQHRAGKGLPRNTDSVGVGYYDLNLHPTSEGDNWLDLRAVPFEIPLGALIPVRVTNLLPAAKNLGTTHITNGGYRVHHVEWNVGEAAGVAASVASQAGEPVQWLAREEKALKRVLDLADQLGIETHWPNLIGSDDVAYGYPRAGR